MTKYTSLTPFENLKSFASNKPPLILFMVSLGLIAFLLMSLAFYVKDSELKNPDITKDWNVFLESITEMEFCIQNGTLPSTATPSSVDQSALLTSPPVGSTISAGPWSTQGVMKNYSVSMVLAIQPTLDFVSIPHNLTYLRGLIDASDIGLKGIAANEKISLSVQLPYEWNSTKCKKSVHSKACDIVNIYTCVTIQAYDYVFPATKGPSYCEALNNTGIEYHAHMTAYKPKIYSTYRCRSRPVMRVQYRLDPKLTVLLSLSDKSLINLHLLHTSYFLFVMTVTLLLYAMLRGRPVKLIMTNTKTLPLTANTEI